MDNLKRSRNQKMRNPFDNERLKAKKMPIITDHRGRTAFDSAVTAIVDSKSASEAYQNADVKRLGNSIEQHEGAYTYLALAFRLLDGSIANQSVGEKVTAAAMFHFAGHAFREIGQLNRAADAYWRSGVIGNHDGKPDSFSIRSLARAKSCYGEIGETDKSDCMHYLEWEARRIQSGRARAAILGFWKVTSGYGTNARRWFLSIALFLLLFLVFYEILHAYGMIYEGQPWTPVVTAAYYSVVTTATVGYGDFVPNHWISQFVVVLNIIFAYALLAVGTTILGREVLAR